MKRGLDRSYGGAFYKTFLRGQSGVGKSTELSRLIFKVEGNFRAIRFDVRNDLD